MRNGAKSCLPLAGHLLLPVWMPFLCGVGRPWKAKILYVCGHGYICEKRGDSYTGFQWQSSSHESRSDITTPSAKWPYRPVPLLPSEISGSLTNGTVAVGAPCNSGSCRVSRWRAITIHKLPPAAFRHDGPMLDHRRRPISPPMILD